VGKPPVPPISNEEKIRLAEPNTPIGRRFDQELRGKVQYFLNVCWLVAEDVKLGKLTELASALANEERENGWRLL